MKFAAGLIKIFSGVLSAFVFGAFLYYTYQYQTTKDAEQDGGGDTLNRERIDEIEGEHGLGTSQGIGEAGGGETGNEQRKQGGHCQVNHEHLKGENQTSNGGLEYTGNGSRGSTADEEHQRLMV